MSKVLFTHSYFYRFDPKQWKFKQPYPPLATILAASYIRENGFEVSLFDSCLAYSTKEIEPVLESGQPKYLIVYDDGFNYLTKMCLTNMREAAFEISQKGKEIGCKVIVCSSDSTDNYEKYLDNGADFIVTGEGEISLLELLKVLELDNCIYSNINGIVFRENGKTIITPKRSVLKDLDLFPLPAWDLIDIMSYKNIWLKTHNYFSLNIATTRGCPYKCNWCAKPIYGNRYNSRSPENVIEEISYLIERFGVTHFWVCDDIFGLKPGWIQGFRDLVKEKNLKFRLKIQTRVDLLLEDSLDAFVESGLETVWLGAESGSQEILDAMDKGITVKQIYTVSKLLKEKGVRIGFFLQFGYLGETRKEIKETIRMVTDLLPDEIGISVSYPLPGTKFYEKVKNDLESKRNWTDSDEMAMMYHATYPSAYYKILYFYVHKVYRIQIGISNLLLIVKKPEMAKVKTLRSVLAAIYYWPTSLYDAYRLNKMESQK